MIVELELKSPVSDTFRVQTLASRMDYEPSESTTFRLTAELPSLDEKWNVGLIVGPSGSGKTRLLEKAYPSFTDAAKYHWKAKSFIDDLAEKASVEQISLALTSAGLSSVPTWMLPYHRLSNGQQQRAAMTRALLETDEIAFDEFSSMLDRVVARTTAMAVAKTIRRANKRLVVATCHYDIAEWLEADWVFDTATATLARGKLQRPKLDITVHPAPRSLWPLFAPYHYMNPRQAPAARCFIATLNVKGEEAICGWVSFVPVAGYKHYWRGHRAVVLPDFQGIGIGARFPSACFDILSKEDPKRRISTITGSIALNVAKQRQKWWILTRAPSRITGRDVGTLKATAHRSFERLTTTWVFDAPKYDAKANGEVPLDYDASASDQTKRESAKAQTRGRVKGASVTRSKDDG